MSVAEPRSAALPRMRTVGELAGTLPTAARPLAGAETRLSAAAAGLSAAAGSCRPLPGEARSTMPAVPVRATVSRVAVAGLTMRLRAPVAAETTVAALANREVRQPPLLFLPLDAWKLRSNQRPMHRTFFELRRLLVSFAALDRSNGFFGFFSRGLDNRCGRRIDGGGGNNGLLDICCRRSFGIV